MERKPQNLRKLTAIAEQYLTKHNKKLLIWDFNTRKSSCALKSEVKNTNAFFAATGDINCFNCEELGHRTSEYFSRMQDKGGRKFLLPVRNVCILLCSARREINLRVVGLVYKNRLAKLDEVKIDKAEKEFEEISENK